MDTNQIAELLRGLRTTPSRRAVGAALMALATSTALSPFFEHATAGGKGGGGKGGGGKGGGGKGGGKGKGKGKGKGNGKKNGSDDELPPLPPPPQCAPGQAFCTHSGTNSEGCCTPELCTECGCCPATQPSCCGDLLSENRFCYSPTEETCCPTSANGNVGACPKGTYCAEVEGSQYCCPSGSSTCLGACCPQGTFCCPTGCCDNIACESGIVDERCTAPIPSTIPRRA